MENRAESKTPRSKGILNQGLDEKANLVVTRGLSCRFARIARDRVHCKPKQPGGGAGSVLSILLKTSTDEHLVTGAVLHKHAPAITER